MVKMGKFLKQAQKIQSKMEEVQKEIANSLIEVESGGGAVVIQISGDQVLNSIKINPDIVDKEDVEGLEDMILTAVNQAIKEAKAFSDEKSKAVTEGMNFPENMPFL